MSIFKPKGPVYCDCSKTYCANNCNHGFVGTKYSRSWDCRTGTICGTVKLGSDCQCLL
jgi:hypothetical protein